MTKENEILSEVIVYMKYAKYLKEEERRETWKELVNRNMDMHIKKYPQLKKEIQKVYKDYVLTKKVLPSMRALADDTKINTTKGWKQAGDIIKGDKLYDSKGKETTVIDTVSFKNKELYKITFSDNNELMACAEHLWIVKTQDDLKHNKDSRVVDTLWLIDHLKQSGRSNILINMVKPLEYEEANLPLDPYILGHWLGDGYSNGTQVSCSTEDAEFIMNEYKKKGFPSKVSNSSNIWTYNVKNIKRKLKELNLIKNKHIPDIYLRGSVAQRLSFIQGLMDSDGHITKEGRCLFSNTNSFILEGVKEILASLGIKYTMRDKKKRKPYHKQLTNISFFTTLKVARLPRKANNIRKESSIRNDRKYIKSIVMTGKGNASCFHVDSDDHSFIAGEHMTVTHNSLQFAGKAIEVNPLRLYNCSYVALDNIKAFSEMLFALLSGTGVGISVQKQHIAKLPVIKKPVERHRKFVISDDIAGWADALKVLLKSYTGFITSTIIFDYSQIREKGALLVTSGGKAPGPVPLRIALEKIRGLLEGIQEGKQMTPLEAHRIACFTSDAVLSGGIRRSALISLFSKDDHEMLSCKTGDWWEKYPELGRANNSVVLERSTTTYDEFKYIWERLKAGGAGEPGFSWTDNIEYGFNPCFTGDTNLLTKDGYKPFKSIVGDIELINKDNEIVKGKVWSNGVKDTVILHTGHHKTISCTPDHVFMTTESKECKAKDLLGKRILPFYTINKDVSHFTKLGFIQGDGSLSRLNSKTHKGLEIHIGTKDNDILDLFSYTKKGRAYYTDEFNTELLKLGFDANTLVKRKLPSTFNNWKDVDKKQFFKGLYSANGSIIKGARVAFKTVSVELRNEVMEYLSSLGINSYFTTNKAKTVSFKNGDYLCKESYDINITKLDDIIKFAADISFVHRYKQESLEELIKLKGPKVVNIKEGKTEEVFDFNLDDKKHWGVVEGVIAHNCHEVTLRSGGTCNLTEINVSDVITQEELNKRTVASSFIGTLQAGYTDFYYLRDSWKQVIEEDALIGVGMTGIASSLFLKLDMKEAANIAVQTNKDFAKRIGINVSKRVTVVKPAGTSSLVLGTSSGIHPWHSKYFIRRIRIGKNEALYSYLAINHPELIEDEFFKPEEQAVISVPVMAPEGAITRSESTLDLLERVKRFNLDWVHPGTISGKEKNNVSATVSIKDNEWEIVRDWMWTNRERYSGISLLPFDGGSYKQTPFEETTKEVYEEMVSHLKRIDLSKVIELDDNTDLSGEAACSGGSCEII